MLCHKMSAAAAVVALGALLGCSESEGCSLPTCSGLPSDTVTPKLPDTIPSGIEVLASFPGPVEGLPNDPSGGDHGGSSSGAGIAVSSSRIAVATNDFLVLYTRDGFLTDAQFWGTLFSPVQAGGEGFAAPTIVFDERSGRFFIAAMGGRFENTGCAIGECAAAYYLAVSKTSSPTSAAASDWHVYRFDGTVERKANGMTRRAAFIDDPVVAVHRGHVVISSHVTRFSDHSLLHLELRILPLEPLLDGVVPDNWVDVTEWIHPTSGGKAQRVQPALMLSDHPELFLVSFDNYGRCSFLVWSVNLDSNSPTVRVQTLSSGVACAPMSPAPQPGGGMPIDAGAGRVSIYPVFLEGRLWVTRGIGYDFGKGPVNAILWAELDVSAWPGVRAVQFGVYGDDSRWAAFPSIMVLPGENAVLAFNRMGREDFPSFAVLSRRSTDTAGALRGPVMVQKGTVALNSGWGPNSFGLPNVQSFAHKTAVARDPLNGSIWVLGQYVDHPTIWKTWIANVR